MSTRVDTRDSADPSAAYAEQMSAALKTAHVDHKVVTYEFRYRTRLREDAVDTRTAVLYRDENSTRDPWWLADERSREPVWLPGDDLEHQLTFYLHRPVTVVSVNGHSGGGEGKKQIVEPRVAGPRIQQPRAEQPSLFARLAPVGKTERSRKFPVPTAPAPASTHGSNIARGSSVSARQLALFRQRNGSKFDPSSMVDRMKMERLLRKHSAVAAR